MSEKNELQRLWVGIGDQTGFRLNEIKEKLASVDGLLSYKHTNVDLINNKIEFVTIHLSTLIEEYTNLAKTTACHLSSIDNKCNTLSEAIYDILHDIGE